MLFSVYLSLLLSWGFIVYVCLSAHLSVCRRLVIFLSQVSDLLLFLVFFLSFFLANLFRSCRQSQFWKEEKTKVQIRIIKAAKGRTKCSSLNTAWEKGISYLISPNKVWCLILLAALVCIAIVVYSEMSFVCFCGRKKEKTNLFPSYRDDLLENKEGRAVVI